MYFFKKYIIIVCQINVTKIRKEEYIAMARVLRPLITGGCSYCSSPDHLVGKGRCRHTLGMNFKTERVNGMTVVEIASIDGSEKDVPEIKVERAKLDKYVQDLNKELAKETKKKLLAFFENNG